MYSSLRTTTIEEIYNTYQPTEIWLSNIWSRFKKKNVKKFNIYPIKELLYF